MVSVVQTGETDLIAGPVEKKTIVHNHQNNKTEIPIICGVGGLLITFIAFHPAYLRVCKYACAYNLKCF